MIQILNRKIIPFLMVLTLASTSWLSLAVSQTNNSSSAPSPEVALFITRQNPKGKVIYYLLSYRAAIANLDLELATAQESLEKKQSYLNPTSLARKFLSLATIGTIFTPKYSGLPYLLTSIQSLLVLFDQKNYDETKVVSQILLIERQSDLLMQDLDLTDTERAQIINFRNSLNQMSSTMTGHVNSNSFRTTLSKTELCSAALTFVAGVLNGKSGGSKIASFILPKAITSTNVSAMLNTGTELLSGFKSSDRTMVLNLIVSARAQLRQNAIVLDQSVRAYAN